MDNAKFSFDDWESDSSMASVDFSDELRYRFKQVEDQQAESRGAKPRGRLWVPTSESEISEFVRSEPSKRDAAKSRSPSRNKVSPKVGEAQTTSGGGDTYSAEEQLNVLYSSPMSGSGDPGLDATSPPFNKPVGVRTDEPGQMPINIVSTFTLREDFETPLSAKDIRKMELEIPPQPKALLENLPILPMLAETRSASAPPKLIITSPVLSSCRARSERVNAIDLIPSYSAPGRLNSGIFESPCTNQPRSFHESSTVVRTSHFSLSNISLVTAKLKSASIESPKIEETKPSIIPDTALPKLVEEGHSQKQTRASPAPASGAIPKVISAPRAPPGPTTGAIPTVISAPPGPATGPIPKVISAPPAPATGAIPKVISAPPGPATGVIPKVISAPPGPSTGAIPKVISAPPGPATGVFPKVISAPPGPSTGAIPKVISAPPGPSTGAIPKVISAPPGPSTGAIPKVIRAPPGPSTGAIPKVIRPRGVASSIKSHLNTSGPPCIDRNTRKSSRARSFNESPTLVRASNLRRARETSKSSTSSTGSKIEEAWHSSRPKFAGGSGLLKTPMLDTSPIRRVSGPVPKLIATRRLATSGSSNLTSAFNAPPNSNKARASRSDAIGSAPTSIRTFATRTTRTAAGTAGILHRNVSKISGTPDVKTTTDIKPGVANVSRKHKST